MRVLFISDFGLQHSPGGAQVSNAEIIEEGIRKGLDITPHHHDSSPIHLIKQYDLLISSNLEVISQIRPDVFSRILAHNNHVRLEHDSCTYLNNDARRALFCSAKKNFFLSRYHAKFFRLLYGNYFENVEIVPDPVNTSVFFDGDYERTYDVVYCGLLHHLKGAANLLQFAKDNPERRIDIFGWACSSSEINPRTFFQEVDNVTFHGQASQDEVAHVFQRARAVFHHPIVREPFCRMVAEALLCGVKEVLGDPERIGAAQYFQEVGPEEFAYQCETAASLFWQKALS